MEIFRKYFGLVMIQFIFILVIILFTTAVRYFDSASFEILKGIYSKYSDYDVSTSLVYDGE